MKNIKKFLILVFNQLTAIFIKETVNALSVPIRETYDCIVFEVTSLLEQSLA